MELFGLRILARAAAIVVIAALVPAKLQAADLWVDASYAKPIGWNGGAFLVFDQYDAQRVAPLGLRPL